MNPIVLLLPFLVPFVVPTTSNPDYLTRQERLNEITASPVVDVPAQPDFGKYFQQANVKGTFILYDLKKDQYLVYNSKRVNTRFIPASTLKFSTH